MGTVSVEEIAQFLLKYHQDINILPAKPEQIYFEERVRLNCFYCSKYNVCWKCPPKIPQDLDFQKVVNEYSNHAFVYGKFEFTTQNYQEIRTLSSNTLHRTLLSLEKYMWENDCPECVSFIGGSCKLCKNGCGADRCNNPALARSSMEGIGINVIKSLACAGLKITFPPEGYITRVGLLLW